VFNRVTAFKPSNSLRCNKSWRSNNPFLLRLLLSRLLRTPKLSVLYLRFFDATSRLGGAAMTTSDAVRQERKERLQDFIFERELAEVYLLLDHISGHSEKTLENADGETKDFIQEIAEIYWPPTNKEQPVEVAAQAATILRVKDRLTAAAKPANGASIAFTLLVTGDDAIDEPKQARGSGHWLRRLWHKVWPRWIPQKDESRTLPASVDDGPPNASAAGGETGKSALPSTTMSQRGGGGGDGTGNLASPPSGPWAAQVPSRLSLARSAYPGLIHKAAYFNTYFKVIISGLLVWLIVTCALSWNITAGQAILTRLDALESAKTGIRNRIAAAEAPTGAVGASLASAGTSTPDPSTSAKPVLVVRYCDRPTLLPATKTFDGKDIPQFHDATERQICDDRAELIRNYENGREDLADWLAPWGFVKWLSHKMCAGEHCLMATDANEQQWAAVMVEVLRTAVLPLFYGFLGAGAAVVRNIWGRTRDSLLLPRDLTLCLAQLALGAVIGACIGLFVAPSGAGSAGAVGFIGAGTLTPSAVSFIAGFSVEGVFVTLESLVKRVFNIPDQKS
jgi:hypothetical protein